MAIEPIKGFYVHDEATDTDGVARYDYGGLENAPELGLEHFNLYSGQNNTDNRFIIDTDGTLNYSTLFQTTDYIDVSDYVGGTINVSYSFSGAFYDDTKTYISGFGRSDANSNDLTLSVPQTAVYLRVSANKNDLQLLQVGKNVSRYNYVPYKKYSLSNQIISTEQIDGLGELFETNNLFDPSTITIGKYIDGASGNIFNLAGYNVSDFIDIGAGNYVTIAGAWNAVVYKSDKTKSRELTRKFDNYPFTAKLESDEIFVRFTVKNENLTKAKVEINIGISSFVENGLSVSPLHIDSTSYKLTTVYVGENCYFTSINDALNAITDNSEKNRYIIYLTEGTYNETIHTKDYVDIEGENKYKSIVDYVSDNESDYVKRSTIFATSYTKLKNLTVKTTGSKYPLHCDGRYNEPYVVEAYNCKFEHNGFSGADQPAGTAVGVGLYWGQHVKLVECECKASGVMGTASVYCHNSDERDASHSRFRSITLKNCSLDNSTYGLRLQSIESNDLQANECIYIGNKNNGDTPVSLEDNGHQSWHIVSVGNTPEYEE